MEKQYEREREAERRAEKECIRTVGEINKKIDKIQTIIQEQGRQTNTNLSSFISQTRRKRKKDKKNMLFFGILSGLTALFYYYYTYSKGGGVCMIKIYDDKTVEVIEN
jgi:hypothetical protein